MDTWDCCSKCGGSTVGDELFDLIISSITELAIRCEHRGIACRNEANSRLWISRYDECIAAYKSVEGVNGVPYVGLDAIPDLMQKMGAENAAYWLSEKSNKQ
jgi:hypothetical protein